MKRKNFSTRAFCACCVLVASLLANSCSKENEQRVISETGSKLKASYSTESALRSAIAAAKAGDVISLSGTIKLTSTLKCTNSGTYGSKITFQYGTLDCSGLSGSRGVEVTGSYWIIKHMTISKAPDNGLLLQTGGYNSISDCIFTGCGDSGFQCYNSGHDNAISSCTSSENYDVANGGENADGFACKLSAGKNNSFTSCTATHNSDDGWDLIEQPYTVIITKCLSQRNGYGTAGDGNGFKLGGANQTVSHTVTYCTANNNLAYGYDGNGNTGHITTTGSSGSGNGKGLMTRIY